MREIKLSNGWKLRSVLGNLKEENGKKEIVIVNENDDTIVNVEVLEDGNLNIN